MPANHTFAGCRAQTGFEGSIDNISVREVTEVNTDVPRIDYTGGGCPSLLLEPQSTNYIEYSEDFTQSSWVKTSSTITSNTGISPDGSQNADNLYFDGTFNASLKKSITTTSGQVYTFSIWIKKISANYTNNANARMGAFGSGTVGIFLLGDALNSAAVGEFVRYSVTTSASTGGASSFQFRSDEEATFEVWGAQVEPLSYATSYIPNYGTSAGVTRSQDVGGSTGDLSSVINSTEGVLMTEISAFSSEVEQNHSIAITGANNDNRIYIYRSNDDDKYAFAVFSGGSLQCNIKSGEVDFSQNVKIAAKYKENDFALWINGLEVVSQSSGVSPIGLSKFYLNQGGGTNLFYGKIKQIRYYNEALSDTELQELTTL